MKKILTFFCACMVSLSLMAQPTDNPVKTHYGNGGYPVWTNQINWAHVIDMSTYANGANNFEKFENARDEVHAAGGGVLYYPGGDYDFSDMPASGKDGRGMMLKEGVVIRGETPSNTSAEDGDLPLTTRFIFPTKLKEGEFLVPEDWAFIGILPDATSGNLRDVNNVGIVWVEIEYGTIYFGYDGTWGDDYVTAGAWKSGKVLPDWQARVPDGTFPYDPFCGSPMGGNGYLGAGSGRLVFGCQLVNSTVTNEVFFEGYPDGYTGYFNYKFGARICIYASNVFVANNSLPKPTASFQYRQVTKSEDEKIIQFDYGLTHGLDINKNYLNIYTNKTTGYTQKNVIILDNYIWNHGRNGYALSGEFMIVQNNHNERRWLSEGNDIYGLGSSWELTMDGWIESLAGGSGSVSDNLSRGYDMAGKNSWVDSNTFNNPGSAPGNDGEGILWQAHGGMSNIPSLAFTRNVYLGGVEKGHIGSYDVNSLGVLWGWNITSWTSNAKDGGHSHCDVSAVENYDLNGIDTSEYLEAFYVPCVSTPNSPINVTAELVDTTYVLITWDDNSDDESGFRIDRSIGNDSNWETLVARPKKDESASCTQNETMWRDYTFPQGIETYYRVVAISCDFDGGGTSSATDPIFIVSNTETAKVASTNQCYIFPNPASQEVSIQIPSLNKPAQLSIFSLTGEKVYSNTLYSPNTKINITDFNSGFYTIVIQNENIRVNEKLVVE